ncbi:MAG: sigma-70 family RNA polymerase sigma factor [Chloroflexota bacterium]
MNQEQFLNLIESNQKLIYKVCHLYADSPEDVDDLYQEIVLNIWRSAANFEERSAIGTWLYRIALNTAITQFRKAKRKQEREVDVELTAVVDPTSHFNEQHQALYGAIKQLNKVEKAIVLLYLESKSYREIGEIMGISENYVGVQLNRIKKKLRHLTEVPS